MRANFISTGNTKGYMEPHNGASENIAMGKAAFIPSP